MTTIENLSKNEGVEKLKKMVDDIKFCFFTTNSNNFDHKTATIMTAQAVDNDGSIWFFSRADSDRNKDIANHKNFFRDSKSIIECSYDLQYLYFCRYPLC